MSGPRRVVVVVFEGVQSLDAIGPIEVFASVRAPGGPGYAIEIVAPDGGTVQSSSGLTLGAEPLVDASSEGLDTLVIAGGLGVYELIERADVIGEIRRLARGARRITSVCTGAYLLAAAGLLDGRRATTHWMSCDDLARRYPAVRVDPDPIFVTDGPVTTSAGVSAGMDLALHLVEADHGHAVALDVARALVLFLRRPGNQRQLSVPLTGQLAASAELRALQHWVLEHLDEDLTVARLAARAHRSPRTFARRFRTEVGITPARWVEALRIEQARRLLEESTEPVEQIARRCGLEPETIRRAFHRHLAVGPRVPAPLRLEHDASPHLASPRSVRSRARRSSHMSTTTPPTVGLVLFDDAEELDWAGPWEVFTTAGTSGGLRTVTIAETSPVRNHKGLRVLPDHSLEGAPALDVILIPGGEGTRAERDNARLITWLRERAPSATWVTSVCTGALVLEAAGLLDGRRATTHWAALDLLGQRSDVEVVRGERYVVDGDVVTAAGVSAGIDMALWLVGRLLGDETGQVTALFMEYDPVPPYAIAELRGF